MTKLKGKIIKDSVMQSLMNVVMQSRYPQIMVVMAINHSTIMVVASVEIQWYLVYILVFTCGTGGCLSRFCSQMQTLTDHGPGSNTLYPHGSQPLVTRDGNEQNAQAVTPGHHVDKMDQPLINHLLNLIGMEMVQNLPRGNF